MQIELTRDSIIGRGQQTPNGKPMKGDGSRCGLVEKINSAKKGDVVTVSDEVGERLINLGSAIPFNPDKKKAA